MKKFAVLFFASLLLLLSACAKPVQQTRSTVEFSYAEDLTSLEDVMRYTSNIVRAKLESAEDFDGAVQIYQFSVTEDLNGNTPDEIHVYDAYNSGYVEGHSYYLFLCAGESALYPHTIYTTVVKDLILDVDAPEAAITVNGHDMSLPLTNLPDAVTAAVDRGILGAKKGTTVALSDSDNIREVSAQADVVAQVRVWGEQNANVYASLYATETVSVLKGSADAVPAYISLPPNLDSGSTYYIFLKGTGGDYTLFSRAFPAADAEVINAADLGL